LASKEAYDIVEAMNKFLKTSHVVYRCEYHFVWVPKYWYKVLVGEVRERLRDILTELCEWQEITIIEGAIKDDHIHMYLSVPPKHSPSQVMKILKGKSSEYLAREFPELAKKYWGMHIWARGYCVSTVGLNEEAIREYVRKQQDEEGKEEQRRLWKDNSG
jgi:putative transposase